MFRTIADVSHELRVWSSRSLLLLCLSALPIAAQAPPSADTFVSSATPNLNYGPSISLTVGPGTTTYIKFNLAGVPANATISKATLRMYVDAVGKAGSFDVYELDNPGPRTS